MENIASDYDFVNEDSPLTQSDELFALYLLKGRAVGSWYQFGILSDTTDGTFYIRHIFGCERDSGGLSWESKLFLVSKQFAASLVDDGYVYTQPECHGPFFLGRAITKKGEDYFGECLNEARRTRSEAYEKLVKLISSII